MKRECFVYLIGWSKLDRWYIGSKYAKDAHPSQLWTTYFTSSKTVEEYRRKHGRPDVITIIRTHATAEAAIKHEQRLLRKFDVTNNERFLNKSRGWLWCNKRVHRSLSKDDAELWEKTKNLQGSVSSILNGRKDLAIRRTLVRNLHILDDAVSESMCGETQPIAALFNEALETTKMAAALVEEEVPAEIVEKISTNRRNNVCPRPRHRLEPIPRVMVVPPVMAIPLPERKATTAHEVLSPKQEKRRQAKIAAAIKELEERLPKLRGSKSQRAYFKARRKIGLLKTLQLIVVEPRSMRPDDVDLIYNFLV